MRLPGRTGQGRGSDSLSEEAAEEAGRAINEKGRGGEVSGGVVKGWAGEMRFGQVKVRTPPSTRQLQDIDPGRSAVAPTPCRH